MSTEDELIESFVKTFLQLVKVDVKDIKIEVEVHPINCEEGIKSTFDELSEDEKRTLGVGVTKLQELC